MALALIALGLMLRHPEDAAVPKPSPAAATVEGAPELAAEAPKREAASVPSVAPEMLEGLVECRFRSGGAFEPVSGTVRLPRQPGAEEEPPSYPMAEGVAFLPRAFVAELAAGRDPESLVLEEAAGGAAPCIGVEELSRDLYALDFPREVVLEFHVTDLRGEPIEGAEVTVLGEGALDLAAGLPPTDAAGRLVARVRCDRAVLGCRVGRVGYVEERRLLRDLGQRPREVAVVLRRLFVAAFAQDLRFPVGGTILVDDPEQRGAAMGSVRALMGRSCRWSESLEGLDSGAVATQTVVTAEYARYWEEETVPGRFLYAYHPPHRGAGRLDLTLVPLVEVADRDAEVVSLPPPDGDPLEPGEVLLTGFEELAPRPEFLPDRFPCEFDPQDWVYRVRHPALGERTTIGQAGRRTEGGYLVYLPLGHYRMVPPSGPGALDPCPYLESEVFTVLPGQRTRLEVHFLPGARLVRFEVRDPSGRALRLPWTVRPDVARPEGEFWWPSLMEPLAERILLPGAYRTYVFSRSLESEHGFTPRPVGPLLRVPEDVPPDGRVRIVLRRSELAERDVVLW